MKKIVKYIIISFFTSLVSCNNTGKEIDTNVENTTENKVELTDAQQKNTQIVLGKLTQQTTTSTITVNGKIDVPPQSMVSISVPLGGYLKSTDLLPGMHVKKGEIIAVLQDQQYISLQQEFLTSKAKLIYSEAEYNRQKELNISKAISDKAFQLAQSEYQTQKIALKSLSEKLKLIAVNPENLDENNLSRSINIYAPIDGFVSKVNVNIGKYANPSDVLFEIVNPSDIHLALTIFEKDIHKLSVGQKIWTYTNTNPEKKFKCSIILIGQDIDADHSITVHCHFDEYNKSLIPGMFMNAEVELNNKNTLVLPSEAIVNFGNKEYVFVANSKNSYNMLEVKTINTNDNFVEIDSEYHSKLQSADIVIKGAYILLMQLKNKE